jgi:hypothetical protein
MLVGLLRYNSQTFFCTLLINHVCGPIFCIHMVCLPPFSEVAAVRLDKPLLDIVVRYRREIILSKHFKLTPGRLIKKIRPNGYRVNI